MGEGRLRARHAAGCRPRSAQVLAAGDVVYVEPLFDKEGKTAERPAMAPSANSGNVRGDDGDGPLDRPRAGDGRRFSFDQSQFNRATQALRQPGSSFKPFVYAAALDNGYTPSTVVMDSPIEIGQGPGMGVWRPENYSTGKY